MYVADDAVGDGKQGCTAVLIDLMLPDWRVGSERFAQAVYRPFSMLPLLRSHRGGAILRRIRRPACPTRPCHGERRADGHEPSLFAPDVASSALSICFWAG
jgi:hypothetical protein